MPHDESVRSIWRSGEQMNLTPGGLERLSHRFVDLSLRLRYVSETCREAIYLGSQRYQFTDLRKGLR